MADINCVCLVEIKDNQLMLVKVRENTKYYFPGGKIEDNEAPIDALLREIQEELGVHLEKHELHHMGNVIGPAYPDATMTVSLACFKSIKPIENFSAESEITEIKWFDIAYDDAIAPAVLEFIEQYNQGLLQ